ncbi:MAG: enoyl-[acyl-carrier-protein] reductase FabL [Calditrichaeota bacterium]|nr:MAG: enoyl-[acyl-carrier-protein] reductase FabL [Calditrichota bacterium]
MINIDLTGKKVLITGGSRGIGRAIALELAKAGADIAINYVRHKTPAQEVADEVRALGRKAVVIKANVGDDKQLDAIFEKIDSEFGGLDILVSNAASGVLKMLDEVTERHWDWTMGINAGAFIPLVQRAKKRMPKEGGKVIAVSSLGAIRAIPNYSLVGASKAALESLVRHISLELAPLGINVNCISAGVVVTDALKHFPNREEIISESIKRVPAGRMVTPEDVAELAVFLCSPLASMIHGQTIIVDGGISICA